MILSDLVALWLKKRDEVAYLVFDLINNLTAKSLNIFGDEASRHFYKSIKEHKFETTRCTDCKEIVFPPRLVCCVCSSENIEWINLKGTGKVYAFTQQEKSIRFMKPDVVGIIELVEDNKCIGRIMARIDAPYSQLYIGMPVEVSFLEISKNLCLPQFKPA